MSYVLGGVVSAWWRSPGVPRLDVLAADLAAREDPDAIVRARIENIDGVYVLVVDVERGGVLLRRGWTPPAGERQEDLADVLCDALGMTLREAEAREAMNAG